MDIMSNLDETLYEVKCAKQEQLQAEECIAYPAQTYDQCIDMQCETNTFQDGVRMCRGGLTSDGSYALPGNLFTHLADGEFCNR